MKLAYDCAPFDQNYQELPPIALKEHKVTKLLTTETSLGGMLKGASGDEKKYFSCIEEEELSKNNEKSWRIMKEKCVMRVFCPP